MLGYFKKIMNLGKEDFIYIFVHMPKTAGYTLIEHIKANFSKEEVLRLYVGANEFKSMEEIYELLNSLSDSQKKKIKFIYGHSVFYGIHKFFNKKPKYIIFLRDPVSRTVSHYNHNRMVYCEHSIIYKPSILSEDGRVLSFEKWFKDPALHNYMTKFLLSIFQRTNNESVIRNSEDFLKVVKEVLDKFYFIGLVENSRKDMSCLFRELGIKGDFEDKNISKKYFVLRDEELRKLIESKCNWDIKLYEYAKRLNSEFR